MGGKPAGRNKSTHLSDIPRSARRVQLRGDRSGVRDQAPDGREARDHSSRGARGTFALHARTKNTFYMLRADSVTFGCKGFQSAAGEGTTLVRSTGQRWVVPRAGRVRSVSRNRAAEKSVKSPARASGRFAGLQGDFLCSLVPLGCNGRPAPHI